MRTPLIPRLHRAAQASGQRAPNVQCNDHCLDWGWQQYTNRNDRLIATAEQSIDYSDVHSLADLNRKMLRQIDAFFVNYQKVRGIEFSVLGHGSSRKAYQILHKATHR